jgi:hypothetical protein
MTRLGLVILAASIPLFASDTITLRDGTRVSGTFIGSTGRTITFEENAVRRQYDLSQVQSVDFDPTLAARRTETSSPRYADRGSRVNADGRAIPAGAEISVRTNEEIQSTTATSGRTFSGIVERDVSDASNQVVIPRGSNAQLVVNDITSGGAVGSRELALDLQSVTMNGNTYYVSTADVQQAGEREGLGANKRTAGMVGGGAVLGTLLGAIAGGGKGAAIGAAAGAAAGAGVQVLTRGKEVRVPAETVLTFRLDQPLRLQGR